MKTTTVLSGLTVLSVGAAAPLVSEAQRDVPSKVSILPWYPAPAWPSVNPAWFNPNPWLNPLTNLFLPGGLPKPSLAVPVPIATPSFPTALPTRLPALPAIPGFPGFPSLPGFPGLPGAPGLPPVPPFGLPNLLPGLGPLGAPIVPLTTAVASVVPAVVDAVVATVADEIPVPLPTSIVPEIISAVVPTTIATLVPTELVAAVTPAVTAITPAVTNILGGVGAILPSPTLPASLLAPLAPVASAVPAILPQQIANLLPQQFPSWSPPSAGLLLPPRPAIFGVAPTPVTPVAAVLPTTFPGKL